MINRYINEFAKVQKSLEQCEKGFSPKELYIELLKWGCTLKDSKNIHIRELYEDFISYFEKLNIDDYLFEPIWYDFDDLVYNDFLKKTKSTLEGLVVKVRDILWELVAFKTDRECKVLSIDNLRLLTNQSKENVFYCCDMCDYCEDSNGNQIKISEILYPATYKQILQNNINPPS